MKAIYCQPTPFSITQVNDFHVFYEFHHLIHSASVYASCMCCNSEKNLKVKRKGDSNTVRNTVHIRTGFAYMLQGEKQCFTQSWTVTDCTSLDEFKLLCFCPDGWPQHFSAMSMTGRIQSLRFVSLCFFSFPVFIKCFHLAKIPCAYWSYILQVFGLKD